MFHIYFVFLTWKTNYVHSSKIYPLNTMQKYVDVKFIITDFGSTKMLSYDLLINNYFQLIFFWCERASNGGLVIAKKKFHKGWRLSSPHGWKVQCVFVMNWWHTQVQADKIHIHSHKNTYHVHVHVCVCVCTFDDNANEPTIFFSFSHFPLAQRWKFNS